MIDQLPRVSVVIAAYNASAFIDRAIASALDQQGVTVELLVIDDRSSDDTADRVAAMGAKDARIRLVRLPRNMGPSGARNAGIDAATGDWIAVLDADDAYLPGRLAHLAALGALSGADIVADNFHFYDAASGELSDPALPPVPERVMLDRYDYVEGARPYARQADYGLLKPMFSRAFLKRSGLRYRPDIRHGEDFQLLFEALLAGAHYVVSAAPYYLYTTRDSGFSRTRIDYGDQIRRALDLCDAPEVRGDDRLCALLRQRARSLERWQHFNDALSLKRDGRYRAALCRVVTSPHRIMLIREQVRRWRQRFS